MLIDQSELLILKNYHKKAACLTTESTSEALDVLSLSAQSDCSFLPT